MVDDRNKHHGIATGQRLTDTTTSRMSWPLTIATKPLFQQLIIAKAATQNWSINVTIKQYAVVLIHVFSMGKGSTKKCW